MPGLTFERLGWLGWDGVPLLQRLMVWEVILQPGGQAPLHGALLLLACITVAVTLSAKEVHEQVQSQEVENSLTSYWEEWQSHLAEGIQIGMGRFILQTMCHTPQFFPFSVSFRNIVKFSPVHLLTTPN